MAPTSAAHRGEPAPSPRGAAAARSALCSTRNLLAPGPGLWVWLCLWAAAVNALAVDRPNLLVVVADQWRWEAFGHMGNPDVRTPAFDGWAKRSVRLTNAVATIPVCTPTRASLLTGQRALTHGCFLNDVPLRTNSVTIAETLRAAGYATGYIGKWHVDGRGRSSYIPPERRRGFDYWKVLECTHNYSNSVYFAEDDRPRRWEGYDAVAQTKDACDYLRSHRTQTKPFLLFLAWGPPHDPYFTAPAAYRSQYDPARLTVRGNVPAGLEGETRKILAGYYAHCTALDDCIRTLETTLRDTGLLENTVVMFTSDHGDMLGSQGFWKKQKPFDESVRVPLWFHWPKGLGTVGRDLPAPIGTEDLMPTLLGLAGVPPPPGVEGLDFSGYLRGGTAPGDGAASIACITPFGEWERRVGGKEYRGIRTERFTYVRDLAGPWLMFDNRSDPLQQTNLIHSPTWTSVRADLDQRLQSRLEKTGDRFLPGPEYIRHWGYKVDVNGTVSYRP